MAGIETVELGNETLLREIPIYDDLIDWLIEKGGELDLS